MTTALVLVWKAPREGPPPGYVGTMGADLKLSVFARTKDGVQALADGAKVAAPAPRSASA